MLTRRVKVGLMVTHAFIIIGMGHGIIPFAFLEAAWLTRLFSPFQPGDGRHVSELTLRFIALLSFLGQVLVLVSMSPRQKEKLVIYIAGLVFLWTSVLTFAFSISDDRYAHLSLVSCLPFLLCTIWTLLGSSMKRAWERLSQI
jgi:hypothetical protein